MVDPEDYGARFTAAKAARDLGDTDTATREFRAVAEWFTKEGRVDDARSAYRDLLELDPTDDEARAQVLAADIASGEFARALALAASPAELRQLAGALEAAGQHGEALSVLGRVADMDASDVQARVQLVRAHIGNGDLTTARRYLTPDVVAAEPTLWMVVAEVELRQGHLDEGKAAVASALAADPSQREAAIAMACRLAEHDADSAYPGIEAVADAAVAEGDYAAAAAALHEFVTRVRRHIVALMRLVEICVDGGLEATMYSAQAQLADAYLDAGRGLEARIISEDLVAREPWDTANIARFRRALEMLGESDPDAIIADRLSGDSPFLATNKMDLNEGITFDEAVGMTELTAASNDEVEVDLSDELVAPRAGKSDRAKTPLRPAGAMRDASRAQDEHLAAEQLRLGLTYRDVGMLDDAIQSLELASRSSRQRFEAASVLGRLQAERGNRGAALEWFERAAEAPAPTVEAGRALLYDLASVLEDLGEAGRALAVFGELEADDRGFRDVTACIERLSRAQVRG
jgi:tetratricopeptide (TPR) repeat protein